MQRGNTVYIETFCLEMEAFESQVRKNKLNEIGFGV